VIKALSHPLRFHILVVLNQRVANPTEIASELDEPLGNVAYHTKILAENGAIEQVRTAPVRGALEHFYRAQIRPWFDDEMSAHLPASVRRPRFGEILRGLVARPLRGCLQGMLEGALESGVGYLKGAAERRARASEATRAPEAATV
jgi:DNA-binding transcriptional ArsR family regulator